MSCCSPDQFLIPLYISPLVDEIRETYQELQNNQGTVALTPKEATYCPANATSTQILWNRILHWSMMYRYIRSVQRKVAQDFWEDLEWKGIPFIRLETPYFEESGNPMEVSLREGTGWDLWDGEIGLFRDVLHYVQRDLVMFVNHTRTL